MKDKIEQFVKKYAQHRLHRSVDDDLKEIRSDLDSLLKEIAEKAYHIGYDQIDYPPELTFEDYWKSVTDKIK